MPASYFLCFKLCTQACLLATVNSPKKSAEWLRCCFMISVLVPPPVLVPVTVAKVHCRPRKNVCTSKASDEREAHLEAQRRAWADREERHRSLVAELTTVAADQASLAQRVLRHRWRKFLRQRGGCSLMIWSWVVTAWVV